MGRTLPSIRMVLEREARRIEEMMSYAHTEGSLIAADDILKGIREYMPLFQAVPPETPEEALLIVSILKIYERIAQIEQRMDSEGPPRRPGPQNSERR